MPALPATCRFVRRLVRALGLAAAGLALMAASLMLPATPAQAQPPDIRFAYILSDHHAPLMFLAKDWQRFRDKYNIYLQPVAEGKVYDFIYDGQPLARVTLIATQKGPDIEKLVAQGSVDMAISGTQAIMLSVDRGVNSHLISPLQAEGNVFVLKKDLPMNDWTQFVAQVKGTGRGVKIGMPGPDTVPAIIFKSALKAEGISFSEDPAAKPDVLLLNMKGHGNVVPGMVNGITDGLVGAQPFPAMAVAQGAGKTIINLQDTENGRWQGHACCSIEGTDAFCQGNRPLVVKMLELLALGAKEAAADKGELAKATSFWLGVDEAVEKASLPTISYLSSPNQRWIDSVTVYAQVMDGMGMFNGRLKGQRGAQLDKLLFDFQYAQEAAQELKRKKFLD